ncbi:MAG TPA: hypothetical protein VGM03_21660 [Phycisphaerae bacterium]
MKRRRGFMQFSAVHFLGAVGIGGCGVLGGSSITQRPTELVIWGDPASDVTSRDVAALGDLSGQSGPARTAVGTDGHVLFSNGKVCNNCRVDLQTAQLFIDDELRGSIRWTSIVGPDGQAGTPDDGRLPFYVDTEGYLLNIDVSTNGSTFRQTAVMMESPDNPSDDTAFQAGMEANSQPGTGTGGPLGALTRQCGAGTGSTAGMLILALGLLSCRTRRS